MSKINVLSSKIFNRIAAGEVVERPASVVKELVENSIDAKATSITISIENGGLSSITITDNGVGIEKSDLRLAILPHATSKISKLSDLDSISTLGFRGEALASIASVSKLTITSMTEADEIASSIYVEGGQIVTESDDAGVKGTEIKVCNLFYNTPVRAKFLKSERSEEGEITQTVSRFIMGNPSISFKYLIDGKIALQSFGEGVDSAFVCVYGASVTQDCFYVDVEKNGIKIKGYIGKHHFVKSNRTYQTVFLNGRYVVNQTISSAISNAYSAYLMKRQYPFFVLSIEVPCDIVDVNVHPNKIDVRFSNNQIVYGTIYSVISKILDGSSEVLSILSNDNSEQKKPDEEIKKTIIKPNDNYKDYVRHNTVKSYDSIFTMSDSSNKNNEQKNLDDIFAQNKAYLEKLDKEKENLKVQSIEITKEFTLIGQALNTFLIFEDGVDLYLIDQHAAHERILFDDFSKAVSLADVVTQPLLVPFVLNVNDYEFDFIVSRIGALQTMGIDISEFGRNSFKISSSPVVLSSMSIDKFFKDVLNDINTLKNLTITDVLLEKLEQKACKSAIKAGDRLSESEIKLLLDMLKGNLGLKCPHGRPIAVKISRSEIDKWFKRIV